MEAWASTKNVSIAAVLSTCGVPIKVDNSEDVRTGTVWNTIQFPSALIPRIKVPIGASGKVGESSLLKSLETNSLQHVAPDHEAIDCVFALHNRERILDWIKQDKRHHLKTYPGTARAVYLEGQTPASVQATKEVFETSNIKLVAAMGVIGVPVCRIIQAGNRTDFHLARWSMPMGGKPVDALALSKSLFAKTLANDHPLFRAFQTLKNRERILDKIHGRAASLLIRKKGSACLQSVIIPPTSDPKRMRQNLDEARLFVGQI